MSPETLSDYWRQTARQLIDTRHCNWNDPDELSRWIGRASAVLAEALRASGDPYGIDALIGAFGETAARTEIRADGANADA